MTRSNQPTRWALAALCLLSAGLLAGCGDRSTAATGPDGLTGRLSVTGSSTVAPLVAEIAKRFEQEHPGVRVDVQTGGSSRGIVDARSGAADLGMISRDLADDEGDLIAHPIARDGVGLILHASNPVSTLDREQTIALFTGAVDRWSAVGGTDDDVTVVSKADGRATLAVFLDHFDLQGSQLQPDVVIGHNEQGIKTVAGNPHAIGYVSIGTAEASITAGVPIRLLPIDGVEASTAHVADGSFPLARTLHVVSAGAPDGLAASFLDYCRSAAVHDLVEAQFFTPIRG
ncbi:MAG: phosphate ABC transporter substrate-binding protein [Acidobacteriota bacterium]